MLRSRDEMPTGTVTFLFTDLEGSTQLWEAHPVAMRAALARHDALLTAAIEGRDGHVVKTTGDGVLAAFADATAAVGAAVDAQVAFRDEAWGETGPLRVRMGLHTGAAELRERDYHGPALNRAARVMSIGHGGQILVSMATGALVGGSGVDLVDLGSHPLRGLSEPEQVFQVVHPGLPTEFAPLRSGGDLHRDRPSNVPAPLDRFVGRVAELREVERRLDATRLLTLLGPGGTGKTRLAIEAAGSLRARFDDRVYFVDLSACRDVDAVLSAVARTVGAQVDGDRPLLDAIEEEVGPRSMLLVLDNFEQVTAAAPVIAHLMRGCPGLVQLATSREALKVTGEQLYPVPPLALPELGPGSGSLSDVAGIEAVQLFVERARAVRPEFELTEENAAAIVELCVRLDGLPLAIELATARLSLFSPQALAERLGDGIGLLTGGRRDLPERQRTLNGTIRWSYDLLTADEQRLLALVAVFSGATVEAVEGVASRVPGFESVDVLDGLDSLVHKSLLRETDGSASSFRLSMLGTIREFAADRLRDDPVLSDAVRVAHAAYFADWTTDQCEKLSGDERVGASERMADDIGNLSVAWNHWLAAGDFEELAKLTDGLWLLYNARGWYHETATLIRDLLTVLSATPSSDERLVEQIVLQTSLARVLLAATGYTAETEQAYERAVELCRVLGEVPQLLPVLRGLSTFSIYRAEFDKSRQIGEQLLTLAERFDDAHARIEGHMLVGVSEGMLARLEVGIDHLEQGITAHSDAPRTVQQFETGNDAGVVCHMVEGMLLWMRGFPDRALARAVEAIEMAEQLRQPQSRAYAYFHTGLVHLWRREPEQASERAQVVIDIGEAHELPVWAAAASCIDGAAIAAAGSVDEGVARFEIAMSQYRALKTPPVFWPPLLQLSATVLGMAGRPDEGVERVDTALEVLAGLPEPQMMSSELLTLKGTLLLALGADATDVEAWFVRAVARADELAAPMFQLRSRLALARFWNDRGRIDDARALLRPTYEWFTEGLTTVDLTEARQLLDDLGD